MIGLFAHHIHLLNDLLDDNKRTINESTNSRKA